MSEELLLLGVMPGYEKQNRVYSVNGSSPCLFARDYKDPIKIMNEKKIGNINGFTGGNFAGNVYNEQYTSPALNTMGGGNRQPMIVASRGRPCLEKNEQHPKPRSDGLTNTITTVQKDNLLMEEPKRPKLIGKDGTTASQDELKQFKEEYQQKRYKIRKLTPKECFRLMGVSDENADKMLSVNSNTQCYKQAGNSIVVPVLMGIFSQLGFIGIKKWNDMTEDEIYDLINSNK